MRETAWDYARGIGIVLVVYGHVLRGLNTAGIVPGGHWLMVSDYVVYAFHMPLFFLLAGMNATSGVNKPTFLRSKVETIIFPYILWSLLQGLLQAGLSGSTSQSVRVADLPVALLVDPLGQFWFLYSLLLCHAFAYLTSGDRWKIALLATAGFALSLAFDWGIATKTLRFFLFYAVGMLAAQRVRGLLANTSWVTLAANATLFIAAAAYAGHQLRGPLWSLPAAFLGMALVLQASWLLARADKLKGVYLMGMASMPIFLMHILAGSGARIIATKLGVHDMYLHLVLGVSAGIVLPVVAYFAVHLLRKERLLGFAKGDAVFGPLAPAK